MFRYAVVFMQISAYTIIRVWVTQCLDMLWYLCKLVHTLLYTFANVTKECPKTCVTNPYCHLLCSPRDAG